MLSMKTCEHMHMDMHIHKFGIVNRYVYVFKYSNKCYSLCFLSLLVCDGGERRSRTGRRRELRDKGRRGSMNDE